MKTAVWFCILFIAILGACSDDMTFDSQSGTFKDSRDKHRYKWLRIGDQIWMGENLAWLPSVSPSSDSSETDSYYYVYGYEGKIISKAKTTVEYATYGALYNWNAALTACPSGWHLPSDQEWKDLEMYLSMSKSAADSTGWRKTGYVGMKLKSVTGWDQNVWADNASGFSAIPGGERFFIGGFGYLGEKATFWTSSKFPEEFVWYRSLYSGYVHEWRGWCFKGSGFSVRCIKNN
jgi:uncharacterized protein (TIGR02145 family)